VSLKQLDDEAQALDEMPFSIGHIAIGCALGYLDYRFDGLGWRGLAPRLAEWYADISARPSFRDTEPVDG
jgi:glutathione S-transferase